MQKEGGESQGAQGSGNRAEGWDFFSGRNSPVIMIQILTQDVSCCIDVLFFPPVREGFVLTRSLSPQLYRFLMPPAMSRGGLTAPNWRKLPGPPKDSGC
jgi:hypothetical protein